VRGWSLRLRLLLLGGVTAGIALLIAGGGIIGLFERHIERRAVAELDTYIRQISAGVSFNAKGVITLTRTLPDPRFGEPLSGLYWQIEDEDADAKDNRLLRSRSLWDSVLNLPRDALDAGKVHLHMIDGPSHTTLLVRERSISYGTPAGVHRVRISAALDTRELRAALAEFSVDVLRALALLGVALLIAAWAQITLGLRPLKILQESVLAVRSGRKTRVGVAEPQEVMPLVSAVNSLLDAQAEAMESAKTRAADLAHGLKTPLTVLIADAAKLRQSGATVVAAEIEELADAMRRHIDRELSRARLESAHSLHVHETRPGPVIAKLIGALGRTPQCDALEWRVQIAEDLAAPIREDDLAELIGNLLDNACKWAESAVTVLAKRADGVTIVIEDDGPGAPAAFIHRLGERGFRLDEDVPGSGFGLAIAHDIVRAYGGTLTLANIEPHGFRAVIFFPAQAPGRPGPYRTARSAFNEPDQKS
jgi:signal transduction histidine kinase